MKQHTFVSVCVALGFLSGCNSLNTSTTIYVNEAVNTTVSTPAPAPASSQPLPPVVAVVTPIVQPRHSDGSVQLCPVFRAPVYPKIPQLPMQEIAAVGPGNPGKVEEIERRHIEELRNYITSVHAIMERARAQYRLECKPYMKH